MFPRYINPTSEQIKSNAAGEQIFVGDRVREGVAVYMGAIARHLPAGKSRRDDLLYMICAMCCAMPLRCSCHVL